MGLPYVGLCMEWIYPGGVRWYGEYLTVLKIRNELGTTGMK